MGSSDDRRLWGGLQPDRFWRAEMRKLPFALMSHFVGNAPITDVHAALPIPRKLPLAAGDPSGVESGLAAFRSRTTVLREYRSLPRVCNL